MPAELRRAAQNLRVRGWLWWRRVALPGVMPYYVTGAITASGGSWNAAIVAELASWGGTEVRARGLGAYIATATAAGRLSSHRARHHHDVPVCGHHQPGVLATAVLLR